MGSQRAQWAPRCRRSHLPGPLAPVPCTRTVSPCPVNVTSATPPFSLGTWGAVLQVQSWCAPAHSPGWSWSFTMAAGVMSWLTPSLFISFVNSTPNFRLLLHKRVQTEADLVNLVKVPKFHRIHSCPKSKLSWLSRNFYSLSCYEHFCIKCWECLKFWTLFILHIGDHSEKRGERPRNHTLQVPLFVQIIKNIILRFSHCWYLWERWRCSWDFQSRREEVCPLSSQRKMDDLSVNTFRFVFRRIKNMLSHDFYTYSSNHIKPVGHHQSQ